MAPVPWSEGTQAACELGLSLNTALSSLLENQRSMVGLKLVLRRYSLHMINVDDPRNARVSIPVLILVELHRDVLSVIIYIIGDLITLIHVNGVITPAILLFPAVTRNTVTGLYPLVKVRVVELLSFPLLFY